MFIDKPLPFIKGYIDLLDTSLRKTGKHNYLSNKQKYWLSFCLLAILITNSVCWAKFERLSLKDYHKAALSWMFRHSKIPWQNILVGSIRVIIENYGITEGHITIDDSDNSRSKNAKLIYKVHKIKDKKSGSYIQGQSFVLLVFVSNQITFPIGFSFYAPDPKIKAWDKEDDKLKKQGVAKVNRPDKPKRDKNYPAKDELALNLLQEFSDSFPEIKVLSVLADALYGTEKFVDKAASIFGGVQVISQLRKNQLVWSNNQLVSLETLFKLKPYYPMKIKLRGKCVNVKFSYISTKVKAHGGKKRKIIALKYEDEEEYRYLFATDLSWEAETIIQTYALRWLVEVFFQDWKSYEGWGQLSKHTGCDGSYRGVILSLMLDHCLLLHPEQKAQIEDKLPAFTVGSLREKVIVENFMQFVKSLIDSKSPKGELTKLANNAEIIFKPNLSSKHMNTIDIEFQIPKKTG